MVQDQVYQTDDQIITPRILVKIQLGIQIYVQMIFCTAAQKIACKTEIKIVNLSSRKFSETETKLLERGLKFTPTPTKPNIQELIEDRMEFTRTVRLIEYFEGNQDENDESPVRNKSHWIPPKGRSLCYQCHRHSTYPKR